MTASPALEEWKARLRIDPKNALRALLDGTASLGRLSAADPEDAVDAILHAEAFEPALVRGVDKGCLALAEEFRETLLHCEGRVFNIELSRLVTLVSIIRRILPPDTVADFHRRYALWNGFFENFVLDRGLDLRREYFRILALGQEIAAESGLEPRRLMPLWLSVCAGSGDTGRYDASYLRVGLLGLRRLPLGEEFDANEDFALQGLARWAVSQRPNEAAFEREWRILEGDFPRDAAFWPDRVQHAVIAAERELSERTNKEETTFPMAAWWRVDVDLHPQSHNLDSGDRADPPESHVRESILSDIGDAITGLTPRIGNLMKGHQRYADATGDVFYLVRTACNIGMRLLNNGAARERVERGKLAVSLAALAFEYDPDNAYAWSLMKKALVDAGRLADAELVGWEAIRRFPENHQWRTQLATILAESSNKPEEAEALLRETMALFPGDPYPRNQLATVLADDLNRADDARAILTGAIEDDAANDATQNLLDKLDRGQKLRGSARTRHPVEDTSSLTLSSATARRQLFLFDAGMATEVGMKAFLAKAPRDAYVTYVAERVGLSDLPFKTTFALAFDDALRQADPSALRALVARARPVERAIVEQAIAASESRVIAFPEFPGGGGNGERMQTLEHRLLQQRDFGGNVTVMLRDFAASYLSTNVVSLAA